MKIHYLQHVPFEGLGYIETWARSNNYQITSTKMFNGEAFPTVDDYDWLIVMGGPMSVNDTEEYPRLTEEKKFIKEAIESNKIVLGICLGAQLIANVLGSKVYPGKEKEIGWFPLEKIICDANAEIAELLPNEIDVFHWHGDTFDIPAGADRLASSEVCENQAFIYKGNVIGLQFHLESTSESISELIKNCKDEIVDGRFIQKAGDMLPNDEKIGRINSLIEKILNYLAGKGEKEE